MNDEDKLKDGLGALTDFVNSLEGPNDIYKQILMTVLFEELFGYDLELEFQEKK